MVTVSQHNTTKRQVVMKIRMRMNNNDDVLCTVSALCDVFFCCLAKNKINKEKLTTLQGYTHRTKFTSLEKY